MKNEFPQNLYDSPEEHPPQPGIIITEMPDLGIDSPCANQSIEQLPISALDTSSRERLSKLEEDEAEARYQQKRERIYAILRTEGEAEGKNTDSKKLYSVREDCIQEYPEMPIPSQEPQVNWVLTKANDTLRNSAEKRIAQINQNANLILHSLGRLKNQPPNREVAKPVVIKARLTKVSASVLNDEELQLMKELEDLNGKLSKKRKVNKLSLETPKRANSVTQSSPHLPFAESAALGQVVQENLSKISRGITSDYTGEDLKRMVSNRSMSIASPIRISVTSPYNDEKPKQGYSQSRVPFRPSPAQNPNSRKKVVLTSTKKPEKNRIIEKSSISQSEIKEKLSKPHDKKIVQSMNKNKPGTIIKNVSSKKSPVASSIFQQIDNYVEARFSEELMQFESIIEILKSGLSTTSKKSIVDNVNKEFCNQNQLNLSSCLSHLQSNKGLPLQND